MARLVPIPAAALLLAACSEKVNTNPTGDEAAPSLFPPEVVTAQGAQSASLYLPVFVLAVVIFFLIEGLLLFMTWRFRRKDKGADELPAQTHGHNGLEVAWTLIPALIVTVMFIASTIVLADVEARSEDPDVIVDVQAFRFGWTFDYPEEGVTITGGGREGAPEMVLPIDQDVRFRLTAVDVIHSFYVPSFFYKRDAIPGRINEFEITIEKPGVYGGQCAEFCGMAHSDMFFSVRAVEAAEYQAWLEEQTAPPPSEPPAGPAEPGEPPAGPAEPDQPVAALLEIATSADKPIAFTTSRLEAQAGQPTTLRYANDSQIPHNVEIFSGPDATSPELVQTETITGPGAETETTFTAPGSPGDYFFRCGIHPLQMTGTLTVAP